MQSTGMQSLKPAAALLPPQGFQLGLPPISNVLCFLLPGLGTGFGWKTPVMKKIHIGGRGRSPAAQWRCLPEGKKRNKEGERGKNPWWEFSNPDGRFMPLKAGTAELQWV